MIAGYAAAAVMISFRSFVPLADLIAADIVRAAMSKCPSAAYCRAFAVSLLLIFVILFSLYLIRATGRLLNQEYISCCTIMQDIYTLYLSIDIVLSDSACIPACTPGRCALHTMRA